MRPCESPGIDVDDSIKKLAWMGFTNEDDVRNALETTNYDINEAISLLMYKYVGELSGISDSRYQVKLLIFTKCLLEITDHSFCYTMTALIDFNQTRKMLV